MRLLKKLKAKINIRKLKQILTPKSIAGAFILATALWVYTNLTSEFVTYISVPFELRMPPNRAVENYLPADINVELRGTGWNLFNMIFFRKNAKSFVDLSKEDLGDTIYMLSRTDLIKSVQTMSNVHAIDVLPQSIMLKTGVIGEYVVPVESQIKVSCRDGFALVDEIELKPDMVKIRGNDKLVKNISKWDTKQIELLNCYKPLEMTVTLSDTMKNMVELPNRQIKAKMDIQQVGELVIYDVPLKIKGTACPPNHYLYPEQVKVTVQGGVKVLKSIVYESIFAVLDGYEILNDSTGILKPEIRVPKHLKVLKVEPPFVRHIKRVNAKDLRD